MQVYCSGATARKSQGKKNAWKALIKTDQQNKTNREPQMKV